VLDAWRSFWFTPVPTLGLHALRFLIGILLIAWLLPFAGDIEAMFGLEGWVDRQAYVQISGLGDDAPVPLGWSILYWDAIGDNPAVLRATYWTAIAVFALLALGVATRLTSVLTWVLVVSFLANPATRFEADYLLGILAFYIMIGYLLLGQWSGNLSVAGRLLGGSEPWLWNVFRPKAPEPTSYAANLAIRLLQIHFALIIVSSGLHKLQFGSWWSGVAFWYPLYSRFATNEETIRALAPSRDRYLFMLTLAEYIVLAWQLGFPLFAWRPRWWRLVLGLGAVLAWLGSWYIYQTPGFGPICLVGCLSYLKPREWRWLRNHLVPIGRKAAVPLLLAGMMLTGANCAPTGPAAKDERGPDSGQSTVPASNGFPAKTRVENPPQGKNRIDAALEHMRARDMLVEHSFWTVFHGILGLGPESAMIFDSKTGKREKAMDYVCRGGKLRGLEFHLVGPDRADVVTQAGSGTYQGHQDQFVAEMTQWGLPRDRKFLIQGKEVPFEAFVRYSKDRASVTQKQELSWAIVIIGEHFGTNIAWTNELNETVKFDDVVDYEMKQPIKESPVCGGTHRLFGLTWAYHRHMEKGGKKEGVWKEVVTLTNSYKELAKKLQNRDGSFSTDYFRGPANNQTDLTLQIHSTGHILEWLALALSDEEIRQGWVENAASALANMILRNSNQGLDGGAVYHATHGLEIYRNRVLGPTPHPPVIPPYPK
jgi:hypothetical protein